MAWSNTHFLSLVLCLSDNLIDRVHSKTVWLNLHIKLILETDSLIPMQALPTPLKCNQSDDLIRKTVWLPNQYDFNRIIQSYPVQFLFKKSVCCSEEIWGFCQSQFEREQTCSTETMLNAHIFCQEAFWILGLKPRTWWRDLLRYESNCIDLSVFHQLLMTSREHIEVRDVLWVLSLSVVFLLCS